MDTFEDFADVEPGTEIIAQTLAGHVAGVVLEVNQETRTVTLTNGRVLSFPEEEAP